jgi:predicted PurR-regulated permease PerM
MQNSVSDRVLALLALSLLAGGCLWVLWPFLTALLWALILVSTTWHALLWLDRALRGRRLLAASLMTAAVTIFVLLPVVAVAIGLADNMTELSAAAAALGRNGLPDAPGWLAGLPLIGQSVHNYWQQFAHDGQHLVSELGKLSGFAQDLALHGGRVLGQGVLDIALSVFLAFFFYLYGEGLAQRLLTALDRLAGERATYLLGIARGTLSGVIYGILGTALAQGMLAAVGFAIAGVPAAVLLGVATFFMSVVPVGPPLIWGGAALWLFTQGQAGWAIFVLVWGFFLVSTVDNVIKPLIISRGSSLPFAIVFLGVLGGVLAFGVIGLFLGPTLLAVGYRLAMEWTAKADEAQPGAT